MGRAKADFGSWGFDLDIGPGLDLDLSGFDLELGDVDLELGDISLDNGLCWLCGQPLPGRAPGGEYSESEKKSAMGGQVGRRKPEKT